MSKMYLKSAVVVLGLAVYLQSLQQAVQTLQFSVWFLSGLHWLGPGGPGGGPGGGGGGAGGPGGGGGCNHNGKQPVRGIASVVWRGALAGGGGCSATACFCVCFCLPVGAGGWDRPSCSHNPLASGSSRTSWVRRGTWNRHHSTLCRRTSHRPGSGTGRSLRTRLR